MSDEMNSCSPPALEPVSGVAEFCRVDDLRRLFGIRRGSAYGLIREGKIRSIFPPVRSYSTNSYFRLLLVTCSGAGPMETLEVTLERGGIQTSLAYCTPLVSG